MITSKNYHLLQLFIIVHLGVFSEGSKKEVDALGAKVFGYNRCFARMEALGAKMFGYDGLVCLTTTVTRKFVSQY
jgi:hypothetical protein